MRVFRYGTPPARKRRPELWGKCRCLGGWNHARERACLFDGKTNGLARHVGALRRFTGFWTDRYVFHRDRLVGCCLPRATNLPINARISAQSWGGVFAPGAQTGKTYASKSFSSQSWSAWGANQQDSRLNLFSSKVEATRAETGKTSNFVSQGVDLVSS